MSHNSAHGTVPRTFAQNPATGWEWAALATILLMALGLRLYNLEQNGWGAEYFSSSVKSMSQSWGNFFFASFDPAGFISVDKPPLALWLQTASVKLGGYTPFSLFLPQVLMGSASVWLVYAIARPRFGPLAGLSAALFLALTPIWVAANRTNNTDTCLVFLLTLAAWSFLKALDRGSRGWLLVSMMVVGLAFHVKMLAAFVPLPAFYLAYLLAAPGRIGRKWADLALAGLVVLGASSIWIAAVDLTPTDKRPYVGSTRGNSAAELVVDFNAVGRFVSRVNKPASPAGSPREADREASPGSVRRRTAKGGFMARRILVRQPVGPFRLFKGLLAAQTGWLIPLALPAFAGWWISRRARDCIPGGHLIFWGSWLALYTAVYSGMGGIMHYYYTATMAPGLAVLAGLGLSRAWRLYIKGGRAACLLPLGLLGTLAWQIYVQNTALGWALDPTDRQPPQWLAWLEWGLAVGCLVAAVGLSAVWLVNKDSRPRPWLHRGLTALGVAALMVLPTAWALSSVLAPGNALLPSADLQRLVRGRPYLQKYARYKAYQEARSAKLGEFLVARHRGERFILSTSTIQTAAPLIIKFGKPVMARGGFHGLDRAMDSGKLEALVRRGEVRFVMLNEFNRIFRNMGAEVVEKPLAAWVRAHGRLVDPALWAPYGMAKGRELYDLNPDGG